MNIWHYIEEAATALLLIAAWAALLTLELWI